MDLVLPNIAPTRAAPRMIDNSGRFVSPLSGALRTVTRPGDRWGFRFDYQNLRNTDRVRIESLIANQRGAANRILLSPYGHTLRGSFPCPEIVTNGWFASTTGWSGSNAALSVADNLMYVRNTGASGQCRSGALATASGIAYLARAFVVPGTQAAWSFLCGTSAGGTQVFNLPYFDGGYAAASFVTGATSVYLTLGVSSATINDSISVAYVSLARCMLVSGPSQTGSSLDVSHLPASTDGLLLPGDWVSVGTELKRITAPLSSDSSGLGTLQFSPPLRSSPDDSSAVAVCAPLGRFVLSQSENEWSVEPGLFMTTSLDFVEAP